MMFKALDKFVICDENMNLETSYPEIGYFSNNLDCNVCETSEFLLQKWHGSHPKILYEVSCKLFGNNRWINFEI